MKSLFDTNRKGHMSGHSQKPNSHNLKEIIGKVIRKKSWWRLFCSCPFHWSFSDIIWFWTLTAKHKYRKRVKNYNKIRFRKYLLNPCLTNSILITDLSIGLTPFLFFYKATGRWDLTYFIAIVWLPANCTNARDGRNAKRGASQRNRQHCIT